MSEMMVLWLLRIFVLSGWILSPTFSVAFLNSHIIFRIIVQADNAPIGGVAQGVFHGVAVRHGENQEEEEGEVEKEVDGDKEEDNIKHQCACPWMR